MLACVCYPHGVGDGCWTVRAAETLVSTVGEARRRQLHWVVDELHRMPPAPGPGCGCLTHLTGLGALAYLDAADAGQLRARASRRTRPSPSSRRARASVLRMLTATIATFPGAPLDLQTSPTPGPGRPAPAQVTDGTDVGLLLTALTRDPTPVGVRTAAAAHLAACGLGVSELAALRTEHLHNQLVTGLPRRPRGPGGGYLADAHLTPPARTALDRWLTLRSQLVVSQRVGHVFLTAAAAGYAGRQHDKVQPAGMPLTARTLNRCHRDAVDRWLTAINPTRDPDRMLAPAELTLTALSHRT